MQQNFYPALTKKSLNRLQAHIDNSFRLLGKSAKIFIQYPLEALEQAAFSTWYPLQKNVALQLSLVRTTDRD